METHSKNLHLAEGVVRESRLRSVCSVLGNLRDLIHRKIRSRGLARRRIGGDPLASQTLSNGGSQEAVVLHRFVSESEETKEDERAKDGTPLCDRKLSGQKRDLVECDSGEPIDMRVFRMGVIPGDPSVNARPGVHDNNGSGQGDGETEINGGQSDETPVTAAR